jgi:hypothetical protein
VAIKLRDRVTQSLMNWVRKAQVDAGQRAAVTSAEAAERRRLGLVGAGLIRLRMSVPVGAFGIEVPPDDGIEPLEAYQGGKSRSGKQLDGKTFSMRPLRV